MMVDGQRSVPPRNLSAAKRALLEKRLLGRGQVENQPDIPKRDGDGPVPLSFAQERIWFVHQLAPASPLYNIAIPLRLSGELRVDALEKALTAVVARHESLRTRFINADGEPLQLVDAPPSPV